MNRASGVGRICQPQKDDYQQKKAYVEDNDKPEKLIGSQNLMQTQIAWDIHGFCQPGKVLL